MNGSKRKHLVGVSIFALALLPSASFAQSIDGSSPPDSENTASPVIIVTANKRDQSVNDVPMSITALSGDTLVEAGVKDASDLARVAPGYTFTKTSDSIPVLSIRGIGYYDNNVAATPAVSAYVDEVPLPYPVMTGGALLDLERVEVLKGPQGTLFGQNSTGGALNFIAAKPKSTFEGQVSLAYGRFNALEIGGYVTGPATSNMNVRLAGKFENQSAWQKSYTRNDKTGEVKRGAGRFLVDWKPSSRVKFGLTLETWFDRSDTQAAQLVGLDILIPALQNPALASGGTPPPFLTGVIPDTPLVQVYPNAPKDPRAADWSPGIDYASDNEFYRASLRMDFEINSEVSLTSITSYQDFNYNTHTDTDGTSLRISNFSNYSTIGAFYQELRMFGESGPLNWMIGGNLSSDKIRSLAPPDFSDWSLSNLAAAFLSIPPSFNQDVVTNVNADIFAGFGNVEYKITDALTFQAGMRYTQHDQRMFGCPFDSGDGVAAATFNFVLYQGLTSFAPGDCLVLTAPPEDGGTPVSLVNLPLKENNLSWRTGLTYQPNSDMLFYANVSKGYKAGAFTLATFQYLPQFAPAKQESVLAYETGFKIGGGNFQLNGAGFYYDYRNKQLLAPFQFDIGTLDKLVNVPKSRVYGAEFQATLRPFNGLTLAANGTYINSKVKSSFLVAGTNGPADLRGMEFPFTAKWQGMADASYRFPVGDALDGSIGATVSLRSSSSARFAGGSLYELGSYALLDLRAGIETTDGKYRLDIWGRNITNKYYRVNTSTSSDTVFSHTGQPATYGLRGTVSF